MVNPVEIPELMLLVFRELYTKDLGTLRLTCKRWYPEADQEMWSHAFQLVPLLRLMPEDAWTEDLIDARPGFYARRRQNFRFTRSFHPDDWKHVSDCARFVRQQLFSGPTSIWNAHVESVVNALVACPPPSVPLFPNVRTLWVEDTHRHTPAFRYLADILFPQSALTSLNAAASNAHFFEPATFADKYQDLTDITLVVSDGPHYSSAVVSEITIPQRYDVRLAAALAACRRLLRVTLYLQGSVAPAVILALSRSTSIQTLSLRFHYLASDEVHIPASYSFPRFPTLRKIETSGLILERAWTLLQGSVGDAAGDICVHQNKGCGLDAPLFVETRDALLTTLRSMHDQYAPYWSLRSLSLEGTHSPMNLDFSDIQMFSTFPHITHFVLGFEFEEVSITDSDCEAIASWWPGLRNFSIGGSASPAVRTAPPALTLRALLSFVERCPQFARLTLPLDATAIPIVQQDTSGRAPRYWGLEELTLKDSDIGSGDELGAWMAESFPGLRDLYYFLPNEEHGDVDRRIEEWNRVKMLTTGRTEF